MLELWARRVLRWVLLTGTGALREPARPPFCRLNWVPGVGGLVRSEGGLAAREVRLARVVRGPSNPVAILLHIPAKGSGSRWHIYYDKSAPHAAHEASQPLKWPHQPSGSQLAAPHL